MTESHSDDRGDGLTCARFLVHVRFREPSKHEASDEATILQPIKLDPLTVADDPNFLSIIAAQPNVPEVIRTGLAKLY